MEPQTGWDLARACLFAGVRWTIFYVILCRLISLLSLPQLLGFSRPGAPSTFFRSALKRAWIASLGGVGFELTCAALGVCVQPIPRLGTLVQAVRLPDRFLFIPSPSVATSLLLALAGLYLADLFNWTAQRLRHPPPSAGPVPGPHPECTRPKVTARSPLAHLAQYASLLIFGLFLSQGLILSVILINVIRVFGKFHAHLSHDPFPWLTRLNHRVGGWIPWMPLYHHYHQLPFACRGNYGTITSLWDHVFGTVCPEWIYHIENGRPMPHLAQPLAEVPVEAGRNNLGLADKIPLSEPAA